MAKETSNLLLTALAVLLAGGAGYLYLNKEENNPDKSASGVTDLASFTAGGMANDEQSYPPRFASYAQYMTGGTGPEYRLDAAKIAAQANARNAIFNVDTYTSMIPAGAPVIDVYRQTGQRYDSGLDIYDTGGTPSGFKVWGVDPSGNPVVGTKPPDEQPFEGWYK